MKKITFILVFLLMSAVAFTASAGNNVRGDVDGDGRVNIDDVTGLINYLLTGNSSLIEMENADVYPDGRISIDDVTSLINYLLGGALPEPAHDYVDLGLPSGTLWATCNLGADNPEDYGDYFAWGETAPKQQYDWTTYKWGGYDSGGAFHLDKYNTDSQYGPIDNNLELDPVDDAAYVNWGSSWRMPTMGQQQELVEECAWLWTTRNGVNGYMITGPNGNTMFLPASGAYRENMVWWEGNNGHYWSNTLYDYAPFNSYCIQFFSASYSNWYADRRSEGRSVRPVRASR